MPADGQGEVPHPRERGQLVGHAAGERALLSAVESGRLPHAWLLGGPPGIGKATLAYRLARFLLAKRDERLGRGLATAPDGRTGRQVAAGSHPNLMVLELGEAGEKGAPKTIPVLAVRKALAFFGTTAGDGHHRVLIVDSLEDLNQQGANALLKTIEEPPPHATILLVSHAPNRVLPTIRSRCRKLSLAPLSQTEIEEVLASVSSTGSEAAARAAALAEGSARRALDLAAPRRLALVEEIDAALSALPDVAVPRVLRIADRMADRQGEDFAIGLDRVLGVVARRVEEAAPLGSRRLAPLADACEKIEEDARVLEAYNLDRRAFVIALFGLLSAAWRQGRLARGRSAQPA